MTKYCVGCGIILQKDDPLIRRVFLSIWIPGILYAFCLHWSSNQNFQAFTSAATARPGRSSAHATLFQSWARATSPPTARNGPSGWYAPSRNRRSNR